MKETATAATASAPTFRTRVRHPRVDVPLPPSPLRVRRIEAMVTLESVAIESGMSLTAASLAERGLGRPEEVKGLGRALGRLVAARRRNGRSS